MKVYAKEGPPQRGVGCIRTAALPKSSLGQLMGGPLRSVPSGGYHMVSVSLFPAILSSFLSRISRGWVLTPRAGVSAPCANTEWVLDRYLLRWT